MATPEDRAMKALADVQNLGFVEFTTDLVSNVYSVITDSALEQLKAYGELVQTVSQSLTDYQKEVTGVDFSNTDVLHEDNLPQLNNYIKEVLLLDTETEGENQALTTDQKDSVTAHFSGLTIDSGEDAKTITEAITGDENAEAITKADLQKFVYQKLAERTQSTYNLLVTTLKLGMQKVVVTDGNISTKLVFHVDSSDIKSSSVQDVESKASNWGVKASASARWGWGKAQGSFGYNSSKIKVRVVNEKSSSAVNLKADIIGSVSINFRSETFPSHDVN